MTAQNYQITTPGGRQVAVWRDSPPLPRHRPVIVCGGFARRMSAMSAVVAYALHNGATVYRFDSLDHIGLSDGVIRDFTLTGMQQSLDATLHLVAGLEQQPVSVIATSLSALPCIRSAADDASIAMLACLVGVVDLRRTLERVFGIDYYSWPFERLPASIRFERHDIDPRGLWLEHVSAQWADFSVIKRALSRITIPVFNLVALEDEWLTLGEVSEAFSAPGGGRREIVELPYGGHELARNSVAVRLAMRHIMARLLYGGDLDAVAEPGFDEIGDFRVADRRRGHALDSADAPALVDDRSPAAAIEQ
jgi:pimeloyl-ACP methyl ester carboxylesterase